MFYLTCFLIHSYNLKYSIFQFIISFLNYYNYVYIILYNLINICDDQIGVISISTSLLLPNGHPS